jgi:hypothetical protein
MPAKSRKQQKYLYANFGAAWVKKHGFDKKEGQKGAKHRKKKR